MAAGKRPVPFRTRKLSPPAPMVLLPGGSGRVGYRRPNNFTQHTRRTNTDGAAGALLCLARTHLARLRIADNTRCTNYWRLPTKVRGATPHCGQPHPHPSLVHTNQFRARASLRIADNHSGTHHWCTPMKTPAEPPGGPRPVNEGPHRLRGQQQRRCLLREESRVPDVEYARIHRQTRPPLLDQQRTHENLGPGPTPHCGQPQMHP